MSTDITSIEISRMAQTKSSIDKEDRIAFINFYTNGQPENVYVPMTAFLEWKKIRIKRKGNQHLVTSKSWTLAYRDIAAELYREDDELVIKKEANGYERRSLGSLNIKNM